MRRICVLDAGSVPGHQDPGHLPTDLRGQLVQESHQHHQLPGYHPRDTVYWEEYVHSGGGGGIWEEAFPTLSLAPVWILPVTMSASTGAGRDLCLNS
jgi:hypothetical protein